jgi:hypothetical protein
VETVNYRYVFNYRGIDEDNFPIIQLRVLNPVDLQQGMDADGYLDSGCQASLFDGSIARIIGLDLLAGERKFYGTLTGPQIEARLHTIRLSHPDLGDFDLRIGFSLTQIPRNLLGRDFFNLTQVGFRERRLTFYMNRTP